jgi:hypothetical protein
MGIHTQGGFEVSELVSSLGFDGNREVHSAIKEISNLFEIFFGETSEGRGQGMRREGEERSPGGHSRSSHANSTWHHGRSVTRDSVLVD